jgi:hypothetical protein
LKPKTYSKKNDLHLFTAGTTSSMAIHTTWNLRSSFDFPGSSTSASDL